MALGALLILMGCGATDTVDAPPDAPAEHSPELASAAVASGIVFASYNLQLSQLNSIHTGTILASTPAGLLGALKTVKEKRGRVLLRLHGDGKVRNADGTFNLNLWKSQVARFRNVNFASYINDGTIVGHFIFDEPHFPSRWGGKIVPQSTVEAMAQYSKQLWPTLITITSAPPSWLASVGLTYTHLDAGWAIYYSKMGNASTFISNQVAKAKLKKLGLVTSLNVLDGGNGSSGFAGNYPNKFAMSASELRSYGTALLAQSYVCAFAMWKYTSDYYGRADIQSAMRDLSGKARNHAATSCRQ
ncbi:MAG TPA: hypothetical protein VD930_05260 [Gemmatimonadales bacterium]|nr:hypothetical protein [Gemmatimonadales bacterium]